MMSSKPAGNMYRLILEKKKKIESKIVHPVGS
jgi:hypothetical protein